jgi:hypothetical protein
MVQAGESDGESDSFLGYLDGPGFTQFHSLTPFEARMWSPQWNRTGTKIAYCVGQGSRQADETTRTGSPDNCRPVSLTW